MYKVVSLNRQFHLVTGELSERSFQRRLVAAGWPPEVMDISCPFASGHGRPPRLQVSNKCLGKASRTCTIRRRPQTPEGSRGRYLRHSGHVLHEDREGVHPSWPFSSLSKCLSLEYSLCLFLQIVVKVTSPVNVGVENTHDN